MASVHGDQFLKSKAQHGADMSETNSNRAMRGFGQQPQLHTSLASHFTEMAKCHQDAMDGSEPDSTAHAFHKGAMQCCMRTAEECVGQAKALKALGSGDELMPMEISGVTPQAPRGTAIPRFGAPTRNEKETAPEFAKLYSTEGDE